MTCLPSIVVPHAVLNPKINLQSTSFDMQLVQLPEAKQVETPGQVIAKVEIQEQAALASSQVLIVDFNTVMTSKFEVKMVPGTQVVDVF